MGKPFIKTLFILGVVFVSVSYGISNDVLEGLQSPLDSPATFQTGSRSGRVIDAVSGKPIEGAVVVYTWDIRVFFIESSTREGTLYETTTNKDGKYVIPSQSIKSDAGLLSNLEPEEVFVYKYGYVWYRVYDNKVQSFLTYVPDLKQTYRKQDNIVKLQPWRDELLHHEHVGIFTRLRTVGGPVLQQALEKETALAKQESKAFKRKVEEAKKQLSRDQAAYRKNEITKEQYIARLHRYLQIPNSDLVRRAVRELNNLDDRTAISALIESLKSHLYRKSFDAAIASLSSLTGRSDLKDIDVIPQRIKMAEEVQQWWQRNKNRGKPEWFADLLLNASSEHSKFEAVNKLRQIGDESVAPYLTQFLSRKGERASLYASVLNLVSKFGDKSAIPHIKKKLYSADVYVRREAALALHKLGDQSGVPVMLASLKSRHKNTHSVANAVLKEITGQDFTKDRSLRMLPVDEQKAVIEKWLAWWEQNKSSISADEIRDFSSVLDRESEAMAHCYAAIEDKQKDKPGLPIFDDPKRSPEAAFEEFKAALLADDVDKALSYFSPHLKQTYAKIFKQLGPNRRDFAEGLSNKIYFEMRLGNVYYYEMLTEQDNGLLSFPIRFVQDSDGKWLITTF